MPRIKNISQDELRRLFEAPEISKPAQTGPTPQEFQALSEAFAGRELREKERGSKIAEIEAAIAKAEQEQELGRLQTEPVDAERMVGTAMGDVPTSQIADQSGQSVLSQEQPIAEAQRAEDIEAQRALVDPSGIADERASIAQKGLDSQTQFERQLKLLKESARLRRQETDAKDAKKDAKQKFKISALGNAKIFATEGFNNLVSELSTGEKTVPAGVLARLGVKADSLTSGNLFASINAIGEKFGFKELVKSRPEAMLFDQQRESLAVAVYKFVSGDVGNIAATESKRALKLIPGVLDTPELRATKIAALERAVKRSKEALDTLINDPQSALLSSEELTARMEQIGNDALDFAAAGVPDTESMVELYEADKAGNPVSPEDSLAAQTNPDQAEISGRFEILSVEDE